MATASSKSSKNAVGKHSKVRPKAVSRPSADSQGARRELLARRASILLKHVSDPTRLEIILILSKGEEHVGSICAKLSQSQNAISHHLALLRHGQIIIPRRAGANNFYRLTDAGCALAQVVQSLLAAEEPVVGTRPIQGRAARMKSSQSARNRSIDLQSAYLLMMRVRFWL